MTRKEVMNILIENDYLKRYNVDFNTSLFAKLRDIFKKHELSIHFTSNGDISILNHKTHSPCHFTVDEIKDKFKISDRKKKLNKIK